MNRDYILIPYKILQCVLVYSIIFSIKHVFFAKQRIIVTFKMVSMYRSRKKLSVWFSIIVLFSKIKIEKKISISIFVEKHFYSSLGDITYFTFAIPKSKYTYSLSFSPTFFFLMRAPGERFSFFLARHKGKGML